MDKTEQYIKMCEKAKEIQGDNSKYNIGSIYWQPKLGELCILVYPHEKVQYGWEKPWYESTLLSLDDYDIHLFDHHAIWLPRQDQLQEMIENHWDCHYSHRIIHEFVRWLEESKMGYYENLSMEQLWLAFVMKEKYGKTWDGENWVKET